MSETFDLADRSSGVQIRVDVGTGTLSIYVLASKDEDDSVIAKDPAEQPSLVHRFSYLKESLNLMEACRELKGSHDENRASSFTFKHGEISLWFDVSAADEIYWHIKRQIDSDEAVRTKMLEPSDFVCMKMVSRLKELKRADPPKARTGIIDIEWMRELLIAAKAAEKMESR